MNLFDVNKIINICHTMRGTMFHVILIVIFTFFGIANTYAQEIDNNDTISSYQFFIANSDNYERCGIGFNLRDKNNSGPYRFSFSSFSIISLNDIRLNSKIILLSGEFLNSITLFCSGGAMLLASDKVYLNMVPDFSVGTSHSYGIKWGLFYVENEFYYVVRADSNLTLKDKTINIGLWNEF
ncbi:MAG: hypothetical protein DKM50_12605 [Candidatus Margulisiibacteriota bacterium]|nr:MAG: hypothetical protein A2X43_11065 [Candidatus Margulisbacteria bacterium GWD2_39_127]OGI02769.1 MAG: hypothetical protein A2X42_01890 [Candidatus Margulisbacteria bacterium GWF2_38_17]OGI09344.1 MAG: hypothetical protein A2X41_09485 [Candidatus Margulisbacteria bacterium GWE2_39_32]PZM77442.1 MAG: hypothetical protein DKM50_12605 [Candidatus Margulisiibacteriota bacterium]HAR63995.1 hypothetical protein [Candidatus Margulisiibacteriota bacterium]